MGETDKKSEDSSEPIIKPKAVDKSKQPAETVAETAKVAESAQPAAAAQAVTPAVDGEVQKKSFTRWFKNHKKVSIPLAVLAFLVILMIVPFSRYRVLGLFMKQQYNIQVVDSNTGDPVTKANINLAGVSTETDSQGKASVTVKVGPSVLDVTKSFYNHYSENVTVPTSKPTGDHIVKLVANGRQVPISVTNKINGKPVENALVKAGESEVKTDKDGTATIVLAPDKTTVDAVITSSGFNDAKVTIKVTDQTDDKNKFTIVPAGKVYFLSKASGKIDVVKTNLDGSDRKTVFAGTGNEEDTDTVLLASRDWKYLMLKSKRKGNNASLYLIDTTNNDKVTTADEGDASFTLVGWVNHYFVYKVQRNSIPVWQSNVYAIKAYNADNKTVANLDQSQASGNKHNYVAESIGWTSALGDNQVVYFTSWSAYHQYGTNHFSGLKGKQSHIVALTFGSSVTKTNLADYDPVIDPGDWIEYYTPIDSYSYALYEPDELYYIINPYSGDSTYHAIKDNKVTVSKDAKQFFDDNKPYPTYLQSPSGSKALWSEARDGKNTIFIGNNDGSNGKVVANLSPYDVFGWYSDDYILVSKDSSELYIMPASVGKALKITDYHKPAQQYYGYGGGYGGL